MKTFQEFLSECYFSVCKNYSTKFIHLFEGRYKQESAFIRLFRQARGSKDWSKAAKLMNAGKEKEALELMQKVASNLKQRISDARNNSNSPLNYGRSDASEYVKGKTAESEESFYDNLDAVADAVAHAPLEPKLRSAVTSKVFLGRQLFGTGTDIGKLTQLALDAGIKSQTSTADFRISSPRDSSKGSIGGSLKGGPAQIATAEPGDFRAAIQYAAQVYAANAVSEKERGYQKKRQEIVDSLVSSGNEIASFGDEQRIPKERKSENEARVAKAQSVLSSIYNNYPGFDGVLSKTFASGSHRFKEPGSTSNTPGDVPGTASVMVHTPEPEQKGREFAIEPISKMEPVQGRAAQGRGATKPKVGERIQRPGTVRFDVNAPLEGQGTLSRVKSKLAQKQHAQTASDLEQQAASAEKNLQAAQQAAADAKVVRTSSGKPVPRKNAFYLQNNPGEAQRHYQNVSVANDNVAAAQSAHDNAVTAHQTHINTPPPVPTKQQTTQSQPRQTSQPTQPSVPQPVASPEDEKEKRRRETRQRMDAAGQRLGVQ